jgi:pantoate kinase
LSKTAKAFAPAAISSFFQIHDTQNSKPISNLEKVGAIGGGFGIEKGVHTKVSIQEAEKNCINVYINSKHSLEAKTTKEVVETLLAKTATNYNVTVEHQI